MAVTIIRTPIVDDDGSGTTGTVLNNAWKQEFYGQIDGLAVALGGSMGQWTTFPYVASNLTAATGTVTVAPDKFNYFYCVVGKVGFVNAAIGPCTTSAATTYITLAWPAGFGPVLANINMLGLINPGSLTAVTLNVSAGAGLRWFGNVPESVPIPATAALYLNASIFFAVP